MASQLRTPPRLYRLLSLLMLGFISGCTLIGHERVEGWPVLKVTEHHVENKLMRDKCGKYVGFGMSPVACAEFNLVARTCDIWLSADFPPTQSIIEHERMHCQGHDHMGQSTMSNALAAARALEQETRARVAIPPQAVRPVAAQNGTAAAPGG